MKLERPTYQKPLSLTGIGGGATSLNFVSGGVIPKEYWMATLGGNTAGGGAPTDTVGNDIAVDSVGNVYVTGYTRCTPSGRYAVVTAKFSATGTLEWQRLWGSTASSAYDTGSSITVDGSDNIYVVGHADSNIGGFSGKGALILKYNTSGTLQWERTFGYYDSEAFGVDFDSSGNIYVGGRGQYSNWQFIAKFNSSGNLQWHRGLASGSQGHSGNDIAVDRNNDVVYVLGNTPYLGSGVSYDILLAKYNLSGTIQWHRRVNATSAGQDFPYGVAVDGQGYVYTTGMTYQLASTNAIHPQYGQGSGNQDGFIIKWSSGGSIAAQKTFGGWASDQGNKVVTDSQNNIYVAGSSKSGNDVGGNGVGGRGLIMKLTSSSYSSISSSWANSLGSFSYGNNGSEEATRGIAVDHENVAIYTVGATEYTGPGSKNMLITKLPTDGTKTGTYNSPHLPYVTDSYGGALDSYSTNLDYSPGYTDSSRNNGTQTPSGSNPTGSLTSTTYVVS